MQDVKSNEKPVMKRIMLKLSGEALAGDKKTGFDEETVREVAFQVKQLTEDGIEVGIVTGGGNFWRGRTSAAGKARASTGQRLTRLACWQR